MPERKQVERFKQRLSGLDIERSSFIDHYKDLADFMKPRRGRFFITDRNKGDKRYNNIINNQATWALRVAVSGMLAGTASPSRPWFALATPDPDLMEFASVKIWLKQVEELLRAVFNASNLYNMMPGMLGELLQFGTGAMSHVDDFEDVSRFFTHTVGSYYISQNHRYVVDTLVIEFEMTAEQMVAQFGRDNVSIKVKEAIDRGNPYSWYPVTHFIEPNPDADPSRIGNRFKPFRSVKYEPEFQDKDIFLSESGFDEFPAYAPRWEVTGEDVYGTDCPGMTALGDTKGLQVEEKDRAKSIQKMGNPPLKGPPSLRNKPVSSLPGGLTIYDQGAGEGLKPIYQVTPPVGEMSADIERHENRISRAFFVDMFLAISQMRGIQPRNQLDLMQRNEERLLQIGPVLEQIHNTFLSRLIDRTFNQAARAEILPDPPREIQGSELEVRFISTLALAQRAAATESIERVVQFAGGLASLGYQEALFKLDAPQAVDEYSQAVGVPPRIIVPDEIVRERIEAQQREQQQARMAELAQAGGNVVKQLADAKIEDESALTVASDAFQASN